MYSALCGPHGVFRMHRVGEGDEDSIDIGERLFVLVVAVPARHLVLAAERFTLGRVVADESGEHGIAAGVRECRKNRCLRDMAEPHDPVAHWASLRPPARCLDRGRGSRAGPTSHGRYLAAPGKAYKCACITCEPQPGYALLRVARPGPGARHHLRKSGRAHV